MPLELKLAIFRAGLTQRRVSVAARISETRLSAIVTDRATATEAERARIARVLGRPISNLFEDSAAFDEGMR